MVEVRISQGMLPKFNGSHVYLGLYILTKLREKGVPVQGVLFPTGVETGVLEIENDDLASDDTVYRWKP